MKKCFKCNKDKDISEFYRHGQMADGHLGKCIECARKDALQYRYRNIDKVREYDRQRGRLPHRIKKNVVRNRKRRKLYPAKYLAQQMVQEAIRTKRMTRPTQCKQCGKVTKLHGHHEDYYKPLNVIWLCVFCHFARHKELQALATAR